MKAITLDGKVTKIDISSPVVGKRFAGFILDKNETTIFPKLLSRMVREHQIEFLKDHPILLDVSHRFLHDHRLNTQQSKLQKCKRHLQEALQSIRLCVEVLKN